MLDNFSPAELRVAAAELKQDWFKAGGQDFDTSGVAKRCLIEVSGGLTEENLEESLCDGSSSSLVLFRATVGC